MNSKIPKGLVNVIKILYSEGYSSSEISKRLFEEYCFSVCSETIRKSLRRENIKIRNVKEASTLRFRKKQPVDKILNLYKEGVSIRELSRKFNMARGTVGKIIIENGLTKKDSRSALISMGHIKEKKKFNLDFKMKAYLFGLVLGDLTPVKKTNYTLELITHSTHLTFVDFLCNLFSKFGPATYKVTKDDRYISKYYRFQTYLDFDSFSFLMETKKSESPSWIDEHNFFNFLAGLIDSDGSVIIRKAGKYFQFVIRFYGQNLKMLLEITERLKLEGYDLSMHKNHSKGDVSFLKGVKFKYNKDYYVIETYKKDQTLELLDKIPFCHPEKIAKKELIINIYNRKIVFWNQIEDEVKELRKRIIESVRSGKILNLN